MTVRIVAVSEAELQQERRDVLASIHMTYEELVERHAERDLNSREWDAWDRIKQIRWLLCEITAYDYAHGDDPRP